MAYRTAEQTRWKQFDFVVGYEVKTTQNGRHVEDICDELAGKYPKDFVFTGWHPQCMCYTIPILKTEEEFWADDSEDSTASVNEVTDVPQGFKDWITDNQERIERPEERGTLPYFIRDNRDTVEEVLKEKARIEANRKEYERLKADPNYKDVGFNHKNGGLKATHIEHNFDKEKGYYENKVQEIGYLNGHTVVLEAEVGKGIGENYTEGTWDGLLFELATKETGTPNNILRGLKHCSSKNEVEVAEIYLPYTEYIEKELIRAISRYTGLIKSGMPFKSFKRIICISDKGIMYDKVY